MDSELSKIWLTEQVLKGYPTHIVGYEPNSIHEKGFFDIGVFA